jgi:beta-glucanase (GH16 family)
VYVGDWDGDGVDTPAVRRGATYYVSDSFAGGTAERTQTYGRAGDHTLVGDWDGDGRDTLGVRRPAPLPAGVVWSQEFAGAAGSAPDPRAWNLETGAGGWGNAELQDYTASRANSSLDGAGNLVITARREADGSYTSARLTTQGRYVQTYGRVEARIQVPRGQGIWPAFWMLGADLPSKGWPAAGEIDVMENIGREPGLVYGTVHGPGYSGGGGITGTHRHPQGGAFADGFHVYAVDRKPGSIEWSVDGTVFHRVTRASVGADRWVFDAPFFLVLNVAVGGQWPGYPDATTRLPQQMKVDYVRISGS